MQFRIGKRIIELELEFRLPRHILNLGFPDPQVERGPTHHFWLPFLTINISADAWPFYSTSAELFLVMAGVCLLVCLS